MRAPQAAGAATPPWQGPVPLPANPLRALRSAALWRGCAQLATDSVSGLAAFVVLSLFGFSLLLIPVVLVGAPLSLTTGGLLYDLGDAERTRLAATCGLHLPPVPRPSTDGSTAAAGMRLLRSRATWRQALYFTLLMPLALVTGLGAVLAWAGPGALALLPFYYRHLPSGEAVVGPVTVDAKSTAIGLGMAALLVLLFLTPQVIRLLRGIDVALAARLLGPPPASLSRRVEELTESRARVVDAAEEERRRIERDLHDGAQQQLVAMQMTLGRLRSRMKASGDEESLALIDDARREARQAIGELRDLTRGLHPPVLTDRGLDAALSAIAARSPVPVSVDVQAEPRPDITVESIAYFVVTEALTNVARHAAATRAWVTIRREDDRLSVVIGDDGCGGADPGLGSGLAGLADRVSGVDGSLRVSSPVGGPTTIEVELPCGS